MAVLSICDRNCKYFLTGALPKTFTDPFFWTTWTQFQYGWVWHPPPKKEKQSLDTSKVFKNSAQFWHCLLGESMRFHRSYSTDPSPSSDTSPKPQAVMCASDWLEVPTLTSLSSVNSLRGSQNSGRHLLTFTTLLKGKAKYGPIAVWRDTQNEVLTRGVSVLVESGAWLSGTWSVLVSQLWKLSQKDQKDILLGFIWRVHYVVMIS